mmetsp:Transcript_16580/g.25291  ORF Transcript_16580/g.25291 Transcript_16580/m.25291 type:complete len:206 (+) Transcript_16580:211-828(+)
MLLTDVARVTHEYNKVAHTTEARAWEVKHARTFAINIRILPLFPTCSCSTTSSPLQSPVTLPYRSSSSSQGSNTYATIRLITNNIDATYAGADGLTCLYSNAPTVGPTIHANVEPACNLPSSVVLFSLVVWVLNMAVDAVNVCFTNPTNILLKHILTHAYPTPFDPVVPINPYEIALPPKLNNNVPRRLSIPVSFIAPLIRPPKI